MGSPPLFYRWSSKITSWLGILAIIFLSVGLFWGLLIAPTDYKQGDVYRILYVHVPSAILGQSIFMFMAACGLINVVWRAKISGMMLKSAAPIGMSFTLIALVTGSVWGKPTWGTWWVWDARLTSTLVLFLFYLAIIGMQSTFVSRKSADTAVSIITLVGVVNLPIVKKSVDWWNTLHQPASISISGESSISSEMLIPLLLSILGVYLFVFFTGLLFMRAEISTREQNKEWFKKLSSNN